MNWDNYVNTLTTNYLHESFEKKNTLLIRPDDIQYLIVPDDDHILELHEHLKKLYILEDAILVTTAIMTTDCICEDV